MPRPIASGASVRLERPAPDHETEFLAQVAASRAFHSPWVDPPSTPGTFSEYLRRTRRRDQFGVIAREVTNGRLAGVVNINDIVRGGFRSGYLGYYAFASSAGRGLITEALRLVIDHAFTQLDLHRLEANIQPANDRSIRLVERLGFRREGFSPAYLFIAGAWRDHERWAITRDE